MTIESRLGAGTSVSVRLPVLLAPLKSVTLETLTEPAPRAEAPIEGEPKPPPTALGDNVIAFAPR